MKYWCMSRMVSGQKDPVWIIYPHYMIYSGSESLNAWKRLFIDFQKAFDLVDRDFLMYKLAEIGITGNIYRSVKAVYMSPVSCVNVNGRLTDWFEVGSGVRQGDSLSPTLFSVFINDLAKEISDMKLGVKFALIC